MKNFTIVKNGTTEEVSIFSTDYFTARELVAMQLGCHPYELSWKQLARDWNETACETDFISKEDEKYQ